MTNDRAIATARQTLRRLCDELSELTEHGEITPEVAVFAVSAIERYLDGSVESLDRAFGLVRSRGRPKPQPELGMVKLARDIFLAKSAGASWKDLSARFNRDPKDLKAILKRHHDAADRLIASELNERRQGMGTNSS